MEQKLKGKVALVTGGARGLGRGYALRMAGLGADIAIVDRNLASGDVYDFESSLKTAGSVAEECRGLGVRAIELEADLTDRDATFSTVDAIAGELGTIDIAVCNAVTAIRRCSIRTPPVRPPCAIRRRLIVSWPSTSRPVCTRAWRWLRT
jgi:NAD(P)-dependent dehydrogenase (short-subunit alcohol dehydrogenase family)